MNDAMKKVLILIGKVTVTMIFVLVLIFQIDWHEVWSYVTQMHMGYVTLFGLLYIFGIGISAWKWSLLARHIHFVRPYSFYIKTYLLGTFLNNFFPSFVGGDAYRIVSLGKPESRMTDSAATVIVDRVSGLFVLLFYAIIFLGFWQMQHGFDHVLSLMWYGMIASFVIGCIGIVFVIKGRQTRIVQFVPDIVRKGGRSLLHFCDRRSMTQVFFSSTLFIFVGVMMANYMLFLACDAPITFWQYASVILLTNLIAALPISIGNIGTKEWAYVFLFGFFGLNSSIVIAIVLVSRVIQMLVSLLAVPFFIQEKNFLQKK